MNNKRASWQSGLGFLLASTGSAVGLGNIWRFPYMTGKNGGAVFILFYLLIIAFITSFALICEIALGKHTKKNCVEASMQMHPRFKFIGISMFITTMIIPAFYFVVGGWIFYYLFTSFSMPAENFGTVFSSMSARPFLSCVLTILFLAVCAFFNYKGVNEGIEKCNKILMPMLCLIMLILECDVYMSWHGYIFQAERYYSFPKQDIWQDILDYGKIRHTSGDGNNNHLVIYVVM